MSEEWSARTFRRSWASWFGPTTTHLELDDLAVQLNGFDLEVHANGGDVRLLVSLVNVTQQEARLSHAAVADQQQLEQVIVLGVHLFFV